MTANLPHHVTVTAQYDDDGTELTPTVTFECPWLYGICHFYPDCQCETWTDDHLAEYGTGHHKEHHERCWMADWFEAGAAGYAGEDFDDTGDNGLPAGMNRSGPIQIQFQDDYIEWWFTE